MFPGSAPLQSQAPDVHELWMCLVLRVDTEGNPNEEGRQEHHGRSGALNGPNEAPKQMGSPCRSHPKGGLLMWRQTFLESTCPVVLHNVLSG